MATIAELVEQARDAYAALGEVAEAVDDEWQYIADLQAAWLPTLEAIAHARGPEPALDEVEAAIHRLIDEIERITDPHRAIDWLSTFPMATALAFGEH